MSHAAKSPGSGSRIAHAFVVAICLMGLCSLFVWWKLRTDPRVVFLSPERGAEWIRLDHPFELTARGQTRIVQEFRTTFTMPDPPIDAPLTLRALRIASAHVDDTPILQPVEDYDVWKQPRTVTIPATISPGPHVLRIAVANRNGPIALMAHSERLGIQTGSDWEAKEGLTIVGESHPDDLLPWTKAVPVDRPFQTPLARQFPTAAQGVQKTLPILGFVFIATAIATWLAARRDSSIGNRLSAWTAPGRVRWFLVAASTILAVNHFFLVPLDVGFDIPGHLDYIRYVLANLTLPSASEGLQTFQTPLYYVVSALLYGVTQPFLGEEAAIRALQIIPLACGVAQVEVSYRAGKLVFPDRPALQNVTTLLGGLAPISLYVSSYVGNEPLAGLLSSMVIVRMLGVLRDPEAARQAKTQLQVAALLSLAILAKVTAILLIPPVLAGFLWAAGHGESRFRHSLFAAARIIAVLALFTGWFFARNLVEFRRPIVNGWDIDRGQVWWQDPGYRTLHDFATFGSALHRPINASFDGFWNGFYSTLWLDGYLSSVGDFEKRPPWNDHWLVASAIWGLVPTLAMVVGLLRSLFGAPTMERTQLRFALVCLTIYLAAMLYVFLTLPVYSTAKATYTLGLLPCYAILGAAGIAPLLRHPIHRAIGCGLIATWGACAYITYFVIR